MSLFSLNVYVFDTGIRTTHEAFAGRASNFGNLTATDESPYCPGYVMNDLTGHGTHVAGIIGAEEYGVAPMANLINVKVMDDHGAAWAFGPINQAIEDVTREHLINKAKKPDYEDFTFRGSIINLSITWSDNFYASEYFIEQARRAGE